jgi:hypothetical protein
MGLSGADITAEGLILAPIALSKLTGAKIGKNPQYRRTAADLGGGYNRLLADASFQYPFQRNGNGIGGDRFRRKP